MIGYNMTQTHGMTISTTQYNALHYNMTQHILLKPVIPSPHPIFQNDPFPPPKYRNKLWQSLFFFVFSTCFSAWSKTGKIASF